MACFLTDFGLARDYGGQAVGLSPRLTRTGTALGTPAYMSPEQARGEGTGHYGLSPASDVWALGCVLFESLAGRRAFEAATDAAVLGQVLLADPPRLRSLRSDAPVAVERVVRVALAKRVRERYPNAAALRAELERVLRGEAPLARLPGRGRRLAMGVGAAALLAAAAAAVTAFAWPWLVPGDPPAGATLMSQADTLAARAKALQTSDPRSAEDLLRQALALAPERDDLRLQHGLLLWAIGKGPEARDEWARLRPTGPAGRTGHLYLGLEAMFREEAGRVGSQEAQSDLREVAGGTGRERRLASGALAVIDRRWAEARNQLRDDPSWEGALLRAYVEGRDPKGDKTMALREYTRALESGIRFAWALTNCGGAKKALGDLRGALADYDTALAIDPRVAMALNNRGGVKQALGDPRGALADCDAALAIDPRHTMAMTNRGLAKHDLGDLRGALTDYDAALAIDPRLGPTLYNRGNVKQALGDPRGALTDYDAALAVDPRHAAALNNRAAVKGALGDLAGALADCDAALAIDPRHADALANRGNANRALGDPRGAVADYDAALAIDPRHASALAGRGIARRDLGDMAGAAEDYAEAVAAAPPDWPHRATVEQLLAQARAALANRGR